MCLSDARATATPDARAPASAYSRAPACDRADPHADDGLVAVGHRGARVGLEQRRPIDDDCRQAIN